jgi:ClpP class serine protease
MRILPAGFSEKGRGWAKMSEDEVDQAGRGRVWSGRRARDQKLVDEIGGICEAIQCARRLPAPDSKRVVHYYRHEDSGNGSCRFGPLSWLRLSLAPALEVLDRLEQPAGRTLLLMPFRIRIH